MGACGMVVCSRRIVAASSKHHQAQDCLSERIVGEQLQRGLVFYPDRCGDEEYGTADLASVLLQQFV